MALGIILREKLAMMSMITITSRSMIPIISKPMSSIRCAKDVTRAMLSGIYLAVSQGK